MSEFLAPECDYFACNLPVSFRAMHPGGCVSAWKSARMVQVGLEGLCLVMEPTVDIPKRVEIRLSLVQDSSANKHGRMYTDEGAVLLNTPDASGPTIKAIGRVVRWGRQPDGRVGVELAFSTLSPNDKHRLARFITDELCSPPA